MTPLEAFRRQMGALQPFTCPPGPQADALGSAVRLSQHLASEEAREALARIIDPSSWRVFDGYLADVKRKYKGKDAAYDPEAFRDKKSLAKADEWLDHLAEIAMGGGA